MHFASPPDVLRASNSNSTKVIGFSIRNQLEDWDGGDPTKKSLGGCLFFILLVGKEQHEKLKTGALPKRVDAEAFDSLVLCLMRQ